MTDRPLRRQTVVIDVVGEGPNAMIATRSQGNLTIPEVVTGLQAELFRIMMASSRGSSHNPAVQIPGMLTPNLQRVRPN